MRVGVTVGRFQVPMLHDAHRHLLQHILGENDTTLVFVGCPPFKAPTMRNPLDFQLRCAMLKAYLREVSSEFHIEPLIDMECDKQWSRELDRRIALYALSDDEVTLYGGDDSFLRVYSGVHHRRNIIASTPGDRGTEHRKRVKLTKYMSATSDFRSGVIYATQHMHPCISSVVDIACFRNNGSSVLLGRRASESLWRFPGGFVDRTDKSLENAAVRELKEETGLVVPSYELEYVGSVACDDWRLRGDFDKGMTTALFACEDPGIEKLKAGDDLDEVAFFEFSRVGDNLVAPHKALFKLLQNWRHG